MRRILKSKLIIGLLMLVSFFLMAGSALIAPVLFSASHALRISPQEASWLLSSFAIGVMAGLPIAGPFIDRYGTRATLMPALFGHGLCGIAFLFANSFSAFLIIRFFQGFLASCFMPAVITITTERYPEHERAGVMGAMTAFLAAGSVIAPILGGALSMIHWKFAFVVSAATIFLMPLGRLLPDCRSQSPRSRLKLSGRALSSILNLKISGMIIIGFLIFFTFFASVIYIPIFCKVRFGMSDFSSGAMLSIQGLSGILPALHTQFISNRVGYVRALALAFVTIAAGSLLYLFAETSVWFLIGGLLVSGIGYGMTSPLSNTLVSLVAPSSILASCSALITIARYAGQFVAPIVYAACMEAAGFEGVFLVATAFSICTSVFLITYYQRSAPLY